MVRMMRRVSNVLPERIDFPEAFSTSFAPCMDWPRTDMSAEGFPGHIIVTATCVQHFQERGVAKSNSNRITVYFIRSRKNEPDQEVGNLTS